MSSLWRRFRWWIVAGAALVVVLAVGGPFVYIHLIEGPAPSKLALSHGSGSATTLATGSDSLEGTWRVSSGSIAGYQVQEVLIGRSSTAVGRTTRISGQLTIKGSTPDSASFTVDMAKVKSDQSMRNAQFDGRIMDASAYPTATLVLSRPIALASVSPNGTIHHYLATAKLSMHGTSVSVTFPVEAQWDGSSVALSGDVDIVFSRWDIQNPSVGGFVTAANSGTLEVLLHLTHGVGNPAVKAASAGCSGTSGGGGPAAAGSPPSAGGPGGGGPSQITVLSTTTPRLRISGER